jgi:hypothetical protein
LVVSDVGSSVAQQRYVSADQAGAIGTGSLV